MASNYLDGHGLNAGLGNSAQTQFPSVVDTKPMQVRRGNLNRSVTSRVILRNI